MNVKKRLGLISIFILIILLFVFKTSHGATCEFSVTVYDPEDIAVECG